MTTFTSGRVLMLIVIGPLAAIAAGTVTLLAAPAPAPAIPTVTIPRQLGGPWAVRATTNDQAVTLPVINATSEARP